ncbi:hypothetical protein OF83DRAFT_1030975, partial [Amylostereum chailletii]
YVRTFVNQYKVKNVTGQVPNTWARMLQAQIDKKIHAHIFRYCHARERYLCLVGPTLPDAALYEMKDEDIRGLSKRVVRRNE